jgi:hypothetical protein
VLLLCDQTQYDLDHPKEGGKGRMGR